MKFEHNPDLSLASTIPSTWYTDPTVLQKEFTHVFNRSWNLVGCKKEVANAGDYFTSAAGIENYVVVNSGKEITALSNVCRHRAGPVALGFGNSKVLQCKYHGWTYDLHGQLVGQSEFEGVKNFEKKNCRLPKAQLVHLGPLIFISLDPVAQFSEMEIDSSIKLITADMTPFLKKSYVVNCNWKVYVDNYLEGYHLPVVHKSLSEELDYSLYRTETYNWHSEQFAPPKSSARLYKTEESVAARYFWIFPNTMLNIYKGLLQTNVVKPVSVDKTEIEFIWYAQSESSEQLKTEATELVNFSDVIQEEDRFICEQVQKNLNSQTYDSGRYSVKRENGLHHFHKLLGKLIE